MKPGVCSVGVQCSESLLGYSVQDVVVQCSLMAPIRHSVVLPYTSTPLTSEATQSESQMSQGESETLEHTPYKTFLHHKRL